jgi:ABC-type branched-subunit amino acid transport system substrate-binding protein
MNRWLRLAALLVSGIAATAAASAAAVGARAASTPVLKIGVVTSLSAPGAYQLGQQAAAAVKAYVKWNNAHATGVKMEIVGVEDDHGNPALGRTAVNRLAQKGAQAFVGDMSSAISTAEQPIIDQYKAVWMVGGSWSDDLTGPSHPTIFRTGVANSLLARDGVVPYLRYLKTTKGMTKFGFLAEDSPYGRGMLSAIQASIKKTLPGVQVSSQIFPADSTDMSPQLLALKNSGPQAVTIISTTAATNLSIPQAFEVGLAPAAQLICNWNWPTYSGYWDVVKDKGVGVAYVDFESPRQSLNTEGKRAKAAIGGTPSIWAQWAWDGMKALQLAAVKAHSTKPADLTRALATVKFAGASGPISFASSGAYYHDRAGLPTYVLKLDQVGDTAAQAKLIYTTQKK